jgi:hypothetical protein
MNTLFNSFGNIVNTANQLPPPNPLYTNGTMQFLSNWSDIGDGYIYQHDYMNAFVNFDISYPIFNGTSISDDGTYLLFSVKRLTSAGGSILSYGIMVSDNSGTTWSYLDLSGGYPYGDSYPNINQQRVRNITGSLAGDAYYVWTYSGTNPNYANVNSPTFIYKWASSAGSIRNLNNWVRWNTPFINATIDTSLDLPSKYGGITTDGYGNNLYILLSDKSQGAQAPILRCLFNAKSLTSISQSNVYSYGLAIESSNGGDAFFAKISGNGNVIYYMGGTRTLWGLVVLPNGVPGTSGTKLINYNPSGLSAYFSYDNGLAVSYSGNCLMFVPSNGNQGIVYANFNINGNTITATTSSRGITQFNTVVATIDNSNSTGLYMFQCAALSSNTAYPNIVFGTYATQFNVNKTNTFLYGVNHADVTFGTTSTFGDYALKFNKQMKTVHSDAKYIGAAMASSVGNFIYFLTVNQLDSTTGANGPGTNGGNLYVFK